MAEPHLVATIASVISAANEDSSDDEDFLFDWLIREEAEIRRSVTSTVDVINFSLHTIRQMYQGRDLQTYIRMSEGEFLTILANLQVPQIFKYMGRHRINSTLAFYIVMRRLATTMRNADIGLELGLQTSLISGSHVAFIKILWPKIQMKLNSFDHEWLNFEALERFAEAHHFHPAVPHPHPSVVGWIDGKCLETNKPLTGARQQFCGHHHRCVRKWMFFSFPNGMVVPFGPFRGGNNDAGCVADMGLTGLLREKFDFPERGRTFMILADGGFGIDEQVIIPYRGQLSPEEAAYNYVHSFHRVSIEIIIGETCTTFQRWQYPRGLTTGRSAIDQQFLLSVHLLNMRTCLRKTNRVASRYTSVDPPTLQEYMRIFTD